MSTHELSAGYPEQTRNLKLKPTFYLNDKGVVHIRIELDVGLRAKDNVIDREATRGDQIHYRDEYRAFNEANKAALKKAKKLPKKTYLEDLDPAVVEETIKKAQALVEERKAKAAEQREKDAKLPVESRTNQQPLINGQVTASKFDAQLALINARAGLRPDPAPKVFMGGNIMEAKKDG
jgi:hypothetical protein